MTETTEAWRECLTDETKKKIKDRILQDLYESGQIQQKVLTICSKQSIKKDTLIHEDILQETFMHLSRRQADEVIEMYLDNPRLTNPSRLIGLAVTIAVRKGVTKHSQYPDYPKHSLARLILFTSNLTSTHSTLVKGAFSLGDDPCSGYDNEFPDVVEENTTADLWVLIRSELTEEENEFLDNLFNEKKGRGRYKVAVLEQLNNVKEKIKSIIDKHKIHI